MKDIENYFINIVFIVKNVKNIKWKLYIAAHYRKNHQIVFIIIHMFAVKKGRVKKIIEEEIDFIEEERKKTLQVISFILYIYKNG